MKMPLRPFALLAIGIFLWCNQAYAQVSLQRQRELLQHTLKEKLGANSAASANNALSSLLRTTGDDERLTSNPLEVDEGEVSIIVDPNDSNNLVASYMEQNRLGTLTFPIYYSSNAGKTWTNSTFNSIAIMNADFPGQEFAGGGDPAFAWDKKSGRLYFSWIYLTLNLIDTNLYFTLNWAYSDDKGNTWKVAPDTAHFIGRGEIGGVSGNIINYKDGICDREWLAVDNSNGPDQGNLYCSFVLFPADSVATTKFGETVKTKRVADTVFGPAVNVYDGSTQFGNVEVDKKGKLHVSFGELDSQQIRHAYSTDGGASFSTSSVIDTGSNLFGGLALVHSRENSAPNMIIDSANNVHVVWSSYPNTVLSYYSRSTDGGINWSTPLNLNTLFGGNETMMPTVASAGNNVTISFTEIDANDSAWYYQMRSSDNGKTFSKPVLLSSAPTYYPQYNSTAYFFGDYNRAVSAGCNTYAAWSDGRDNLGPKIYFAKSNPCTTTGIQEISSINSSIQLQSLYPNPANDNVTLEISDSKNENITVTLSDITGRFIINQQYMLHDGTQLIKLSFNKQLTAGSYILSVKNNDGLVATRHLQVL